jgi:hypothetical protein
VEFVASAPANSAPPAISGTAEVGQTLTASSGTWMGTQPIVYDYQWRRCDGAGDNCADLAGATQSTYTLVPTDAGSTMRVRVSASNSAGSSSADSAQTAQVASIVPTAPSSNSPPTISGTAEVGQTLTASSGTWSGTQPITYAYQWRRCDGAGDNCADLAGATQSTYSLVPADAGSTLRVRVTASNAAASSSADSAQTARVAPQPSSGTLTVPIMAGADDGYLEQKGPASGGYPPSGSVITNTTAPFLAAARRLSHNNDYSVMAALLRFDTSALPDGATVTAAALELRVTGKADADNRALQAEWYPASSWPIDGGDWSLDSSATALAGADLTGIATGQVTSFPLTGLGGLSTTGSTALRLHVSGGQPAGENYLVLAAFEDASLPAAQLVLEWSMP